MMVLNQINPFGLHGHRGNLRLGQYDGLRLAARTDFYHFTSGLKFFILGLSNDNLVTVALQSQGYLSSKITT